MNLTPHAERFWRRVDKAGPVPDARPDLGPCWLWVGAHVPDGYGSFSLPGRPQVGAHRVAWELVNGPIPEGRQIDHLCRRPGCVNPGHMEVVTLAENVLRGEGPTARNARKSHCDAGHPLEGDNVRTTKEGWRRCRACQRDWARKARAA